MCELSMTSDDVFSTESGLERPGIVGPVRCFGCRAPLQK